MRKIEEEMVAAVQQGRTWSKDNTRVTVCDDTGWIEVELFGHVIAEGHSYADMEVNLPVLRYWPTNTTKSRLRALGFNVATKNYTTYLDGVEV